MNHTDWKKYRCDKWDMNCDLCLKAECLDDPEYEVWEDV